MNNNETTPEKLWSISFIYILFVNTINSSAFGMSIPMVPGYAVNIGATLSFAGVLTGVFSFVALLGRPIAGIIGDRLNKKRLLAISLFLNGFSVTLYAIAPGLIWLLPVRILHGLMFSVSGTVCISLGSTYIPQKRLGEGVGYLGLGQIIGMALGPNIGIYLRQFFSYKFCFLLCGIAIMIAGISMTALRYEHTAQEFPDNGSKRAFSFQDIIAVELLPNIFFTAVLAVGYGLNISYIVMLGSVRNIDNIGFYFIVNSVFLLAARPLLGRMTDRKGVVYAIIPGYLMAGIAMVLIGFSDRLLPVIIAAVLAAAGFGAFPAFQADCLKKLGSSRRTVATGAYFIGMDSGIGVGQIFGGILADSFGFNMVYSSAAILMLAGIGLYMLYHKKQTRLH